MKTITLTDEAYERLKSWKEGPKESFSKVVLKTVRKRGTAEALDEAFEHLPALTNDQGQVMEEAVAWGNTWENQTRLAGNAMTGDSETRNATQDAR